MLKTYKYRLYPKTDQISMIEKTISTCRFVYNISLETKIRAWESAQIHLTAYDLQRQLTDLKKEYKWISEVDSQSLQASILNMDSAFKYFFNGYGFPKFKKKGGRQSFTCKNGVRRINWEDSTLTIPKIKNIPIVLSKHFLGVIKRVVISKTSTNKYYASILVEDSSEFPGKKEINANSSVGIDVGIKSFAVISDGRFYEPNQKLKESLYRLKYDAEILKRDDIVEIFSIERGADPVLYACYCPDKDIFEQVTEDVFK